MRGLRVRRWRKAEVDLIRRMAGKASNVISSMSLKSLA